MPYTFNGTGTTWLGARDREDDDSYVTTEWIVLFFIPIIPIGSFRVRSVSGNEYLTWRIPFQWRQIRNVYLTESILLTILWVWLEVSHHSNVEPPKQIEQIEQSR